MNDTEQLFMADYFSDHSPRSREAAEKRLQALLDEARKATLNDLRGWIDRNHYQPVNEADRWVQASGEIIAEIDTRLAALTQKQEN